MNEAAALTHTVIETLMAEQNSHKKLGDHRYAIKQGSTFVIVDVIQSETKAMVRCTAQVIKMDEFSNALAMELMKQNNSMRFGAFSLDVESNMVIFSHALLGGNALDQDALRASLHDVALISDQFDHQLAEKYGGQTMRDLLNN